MFAANKNHPNPGGPLLQPRGTLPTSSPKHLVELDSFKFDYQTGDGYGFTVRIPGRNPQRARTQDVLERARQHPPQTFDEARSKPRKRQVTPAYAIDLNNEHFAFPNATPSPHTSHHRRNYGNDSGEEPAKTLLRRGMTVQFDRDVLERRNRNFSRSRSEYGMLVRSDDNEEVKAQSAGHRPRNERPLFEPSAPIPSYSHVSAPHVNRKRWRTTWRAIPWSHGNGNHFQRTLHQRSRNKHCVQESNTLTENIKRPLLRGLCKTALCQRRGN